MVHGTLSTSELQPQRDRGAPGVHHAGPICFVLPNWIGDVIMATPTLRAISEHFGNSTNIVGVMRPYVAQVLDGTPWVRTRIFHDPYSRDPHLHSLAVVRQLRRLKIDTVVLLTNSLRAGAIAWLSGARRRIGYRRYGRGLLLTHGLNPRRTGRIFTPVSAVDYYLGLAAQLGCTIQSKQLELATTPNGESQANDIWRRLRWGDSRDVVTLCPAGIYGVAKHWPVEHFADLARQLVRDLGCRVLVTCGPAERENARRIVRLANQESVASLADEPVSIELTKACIRRSRIVVSTDSGPRHIAAAFGVPTVALFGSTDPRWSINYNHDEVHLRTGTECSPCGKRLCPYGTYHCMKELTPDLVHKIALQLWARRAANSAA